MDSTTNRHPKKEKLIDILHQSLVDAGYNVERDGWDETGTNDPCEWLDVKADMVDNKQMCIHFYFTNNSTTLEQVNVMVTEFELVEGDTERLFKFKNAADIKSEKEAEEKKRAEEQKKKEAPRGYVSFFC